MSKLQEAFRFWLLEAKFNPESLNSLDSLEAKRAYVEKAGLRFMGEGSTRMVFALDSKRVLKLAINPEGVVQNTEENKVFQDPSMQFVVARVFQQGTDLSWLVSEIVRPLESEEEFQALTGVPWVVVAMFLAEKDPTTAPEKMQRNFARLKQEPYVTIRQDLERYLSSPWFQDLREAFTGSLRKLSPSDLTRLDHWGKTADQRVVLLDSGY